MKEKWLQDIMESLKDVAEEIQFEQDQLNQLFIQDLGDFQPTLPTGLGKLPDFASQ